MLYYHQETCSYFRKEIRTKSANPLYSEAVACMNILIQTVLPSFTLLGDEFREILYYVTTTL